MLLPEIISPFTVSLLLKDTDPLMSIIIPFIVSGLLSVTELPPVTLKITFAAVRPPIRFTAPNVTPPLTLITNDWLAEPDKVKTKPFWLIPVKAITFRPGTVALIVVLDVRVPSDWFGVSAARFEEAAEACIAAVVIVPVEVVFTPPRAVNPEVVESALVLNL